MKIRTGFVSNSSSSSFCIVGGSFDLDADSISEEAYKLLGVTSESSMEDIREEIGKFFNSLGLDYKYDSYSNYVGYDLEDGSNHDETINQLKTKAQLILKKLPEPFTNHSVYVHCGELYE